MGTPLQRRQASLLRQRESPISGRPLNVSCVTPGDQQQSAGDDERASGLGLLPQPPRRHARRRSPPACLPSQPPPLSSLSLCALPPCTQDADLLDEHEQLELIEQMERAASRQRHYSKSLLTLLGTAVALIYLFFACKQLLAPFSTPHQARLAGHLRPHAVAVADFGGAAAAMLAVAAVLCYIPGGHQAGANWRTLLALAALVSGLEAAFWSVAMWRVAQDTAVSGCQDKRAAAAAAPASRLLASARLPTPRPPLAFLARRPRCGASPGCPSCRPVSRCSSRRRSLSCSRRDQAWRRCAAHATPTSAPDPAGWLAPACAPTRGWLAALCIVPACSAWNCLGGFTN